MLPKYFEPYDVTSDPLVQLLTEEGEEAEAEVLESQLTVVRTQVVTRDIIEDSGEELRVRVTQREASQLVTVYRKAK